MDEVFGGLGEFRQEFFDLLRVGGFDAGGVRGEVAAEGFDGFVHGLGLFRHPFEGIVHQGDAHIFVVGEDVVEGMALVLGVGTGGSSGEDGEEKDEDEGDIRTFHGLAPVEVWIEVGVSGSEVGKRVVRSRERQRHRK